MGLAFPFLPALIGILVPWTAQAQPAGGTVVAGQATITTPSLHSTLISQSSSKAIIDWQNFSVANGQSVQFAQPGASSITLNRVTGGTLSSIAGSITANGQVWLINPNGVVFGGGAQVNVGGLLATTSDIANNDFLSGNYAFGGAPAGSAVVNKGAINASTGGSVVLSAPRVVNKGVITAHAGHVVLGGARAFTVDFDGDRLISYQVKTASKGDAGTDGAVLMTRRAAAQVQRDVVNDQGMTEATSAHVENGEVVLDGGGVTNSGSVDVSGRVAGQTGGTVELQAKTVTVSDGAKIDASGDAGGGTVLIGGNFHGAGPQLNAQRTTVGKAVITADAVTSGDGGKVAVWSNGKTRVAAAISAKGGAQSGNGGQMETSGQTLQVADSTTVDTSAAFGLSGNWLLDPGILNIANSGTQGLDANHSFTLADDPSTTDTVTINPNTIATALGSSDVTLEATTLIGVTNTVSYNSSHNLVLLSKGSISLSSASLQNAGSGAITLTAGWDGNSAAGGAAASGTYGLNSGSITISGTAAAVGTASGNTYINSYALALQAAQAVNAYAQVGYHGVGGGNIFVQTLGGGIALNETQGRTVQIGNGGYDGTVNGGVTGNITIATTGATLVSTNGGTARITNHSNGAFPATGNVTLTTGTLGSGSSNTVYDVNTLIADNLGGGNVSVSLTAATAATTLGAVSYSSSYNVSIATNNAFNFTGTIANSGTGSASLTSGLDLTDANALTFASGGLTLHSTGGQVNITGQLTVGGTLSATSDTGVVSLGNTGNLLSGTVNATAFGGGFGGPGSIVINNNQALSIGNLIVNNAGPGNDYGSIVLTASGGDITLKGHVDGGGITITANNGGILETATGTLTSHKTGNNTIGGGFALNAQEGNINLPNNNIIETATGAQSQFTTGELVFVASGDVNIQLVNNSVAFYGGNAGGNIKLAVSGQTGTIPAYAGITLENPMSAGGEVTLLADGSITQDTSAPTAITAATGLIATSAFGNIALADTHNAVTGAVLLNTQGGATNGAGNAAFNNSVSTILGAPVADDNDPALYNTLISGTLTVNVVDPSAANTPTLTLDGRLHVQSATGDTTLHAAGDLINNNGDGTIYTDHVNLVSDSGTVGAGGWTFGDGAYSNVPLNMFLSAPHGDGLINPGDINFGGTAMAARLGYGVKTNYLLVFGNGVVTQDSTTSGILQVNNLDIHAAGSVTLTNAHNAVTGPVDFRSSGNISFTNSLDTVLERANAGGLDANNNPLPASSVAIRIADPSGATQPGLTLSVSFDDDANQIAHVTSIDSTGPVTLYAAGGIAEVPNFNGSGTGHVVANGLTATSATRDISLDNTANAITGLVQLNAGGSAVLTDGSAVTLGTSTVGGTLVVTSSGNVTINSGAILISAALGDNSIVLSGTNFINNEGADALHFTNGFRIYSVGPSGDSFNNLDSHNSAVWNATYGDIISATGNRYVFQGQPVLSVTSTNVSKPTAGTDVTAQVASAYFVSGLQGVQGAFQDGYTGTPSVTSRGSAPNTDAAGTQYPINVALGSLVLPTGYSFQAFNSGILTVAGAAGPLPTLLYVANPFTRAYGSANPAFTGTVTGFKNSDTQQSATTGTLVFNSSATASSSVGSYAILGSGLSSSTYQFAQAPGNATALTINAALLSYVAATSVKTYGSDNPAFSGTVTGFVNGDTQKSATQGTLVFNSSAVASSNVGSYAITGSGLAANNYTFVQAAGNSVALTINPIILNEGLTGTVTKTFDNTNTATLTQANYTALSGVRSGDSVALARFPTAGTYDTAQVGSEKVVTVTGLALAGANAGNYSLASSVISAPIGVITAASGSTSGSDGSQSPPKSTTPPSSALLSVTIAQVQSAPVLNAAITSSIVTPSPAASVPAPNEAPAAQIASLTTASPLESLTTSDSGAQALEPATPADAATSFLIDSMNGGPAGGYARVDVLIPGVLRAVTGRRPMPPGTGDNLSAWGNPALWQ